MRPARVDAKRGKFETRLSSFAILIALMGLASVAGATYSLPPDRSVTWRGNVGVLNDIPARTTIYTTLNPSGGNDTSAIQTAINNCPTGQVVKLSSGTFNISSPITVKTGCTLRGAGMGRTIIKGMSGMSGAYVVGIYNPSSSLGSAVNIVGGLSKGSTSITTSSSHGWSAGDLVVIDQLNSAQTDPPVLNVGTDGTCTWCGRSSGTRSLGQVAKIVAVPTSTTATLEVPLYWNYNSSLTPQGVKINGVTKDAGIEDLTVDNSLSGTSQQVDNGGTIVLRGNSNCWLLRVESIGSYQTMVRMLYNYRDTVRGCKFHEGVPATPVNGAQYAPGRAYCIFLNPANSGNLIENNQIYHLSVGIIMNGATSGNVIAYNYITALYHSTSSWNVYTTNFHGAHPVMNLLEGNYSDGILNADFVWGSSSHNTYFRNKHSLSPNKTCGTWNVNIMAKSLYYNIVGNVLGTPQNENTYELNNVDFAMCPGQKSIYNFGYTNTGDSGASGNDPQVYATVKRHGNWDSYTNSVRWNGTDDRALPPSLYLSSKPGWWGNVAWPAIGPDISPMYPAAPAVGSGTPWVSSQPAPSPPVLLRVQ